MQLFEHVKEVLSKNESFCKDGKLFKNNVVEAALKLDAELLTILLKDETTKKHFFTTIEGVQVFDKVKFQQFVSNKQFLPDSYTNFKNKIGLTAKGEYLTEANEVVLDFPYKDCVLEGGQTKEDQKRKEIFWNETLASDEVDRLFDAKVLTNWKRIDESGEQEMKNLDSTDTNFLLKGNNLLVLHSLKQRFKKEVNLIYIDPPYNTGNDGFNYNDSFTNATWLTFMLNRLKVARELMAETGVILVQINDHNQTYLKTLLDEVFGTDNFINLISVRTKSPSGFKTVNLGLFETAEYILMYGKDKKKFKYNPQYVNSGYDENYSGLIKNIEDSYDKWEIDDLRKVICRDEGIDPESTHHPYSKVKSKIGEGLYLQKLADLAIQNDKAVFRLTAIGDDAGKETIEVRDKSKDNPGIVYRVERESGTDRYILDGQEIAFYSNKVKEIDGERVPTTLLTNIWSDIAYEGIAAEGGVRLKKGKKPEKLLRRIIEMTTNPNDLVLDFHLGSGTTCAVAHKLGRRYIGIEQLDYGKNDSLVRLKNVVNGDSSGISSFVSWKGGGSFVYAELAENAASYISKIEALKSSKEAATLWNELKEEPFISYRVSPSEFDANIESFEQLELDDQKKLLISTIDKNHLYINYADIDDKTYNISDADKKLNLQFYNR